MRWGPEGARRLAPPDPLPVATSLVPCYDSIRIRDLAAA